MSYEELYLAYSYGRISFEELLRGFNELRGT